MVKASFVEIYNEILNDLLTQEGKVVKTRMADAKTMNLIQREVTTAVELYELMSIARSNRTTASTAGNERSSRSHAVTRLEVIGENIDRREQLIGSINFVDLAASESPKSSEPGVRYEETKKINFSLGARHCHQGAGGEEKVH
jgi:kinesin family member C1